MADYFPLLARALDGLADSTPAARRTVYDRAQAALLTQLRSLQPPLSPAEIDRERASLDEAIARAESVYGAEPSGASLPDPEPSPVKAERSRSEPTPAIRKGGRRGRTLAIGIGLPAVIGAVAVAAWLWRDDPATPIRAPAQQAQAPARPPGPDAKIADRVAGGPTAQPASPPAREEPARPAPVAPPAAPAPPPLPAPSAPARSGEPTTADLAVAQRAVMIEENAADPQNPKLSPGRALWRLDATNAGQGQPLETVVRATVEVPEEGLTLQLAMRRNLDATLPASHTIELTFAPTGQGRAVRDVGLPQIRTDETARGAALAGLSVPVKENVFLIGLSDLKSDVDRNAALLQRGAWIDLQMRFASGARANLSFEKGISGERVLTEAFRQWDAPR